jgi:hypothetical protein
MSEWWVGLGVAETLVECGGAAHPLVWEDGILHAPAHEDAEGERALAALGGTRCECVDLLDAWARCRHDIDALVFASRGPGDHFAVEDEARRAFAGHMPPEPHDELLSLLRLGGGLSERLIATVAAEWARRIEQPGGEYGWARARLHAGLYGRLVPALRFWLGDPTLSVDLTLVGATDPRSLSRQGDTLQVGLPFAWVSEVWARGFATVWGRFCIAASAEDDGRWALSSIGQDLGSPQPLGIEFPIRVRSPAGENQPKG